MPPMSENNPEASVRRATPAQPGQHPPSSIQRKLLLILTMLVLGLPVIVVMLAPPSAGGWILWRQVALYRQDGRWRALSLFELATYTVDREFSDALRWPGVSSCSEFVSSRSPAEKLTGSSSARSTGVTTARCPELSPAQSWLLSPESPSGGHRFLTRVLRAIPVSSLLFLLGLITAYFFRLIGEK